LRYFFRETGHDIVAGFLFLNGGALSLTRRPAFLIIACSRQPTIQQ